MKEKTEIVPLSKKELILEGDPEKQLEFATKAANALMKVVKPKKINGKDYLEFGGWQILGRFFGSTVGVEWTHKLVDDKNVFLGYEARAVVLQKGEAISWAEASCLISERNWKSREEFALKSMAQTRASAKALRNAFGWVAELAGLASTPAEEMAYEVEYYHSPIPAKVKVVSTGDDDGRSKDTTMALKAEIKKLCDSIALEPLITGDDYVRYVQDNTGMNLKEAGEADLKRIIERLKA